MDAEYLRTELKKAGYIITKQNIIRTQKNHRTGESPYDLLAIMRNNVVRLPSGRDVDMSLVNSVRITDRYSGITLVTPFEEIEVPKGMFSKDDLASIENTYVTTAMPKTLSQLNDMFVQLYPKYKDQLYYDEMRERAMIDESMFDITLDKGSFAEFDDITEIKFYDSIERRLTELGCDGNPPSTITSYRSLLMKIHETKRNFFKEWVLSMKWDGKPRVDTWFKDIFGATAGPLKALGLEEIYLAKAARAWFVGGISRMFKATVCEVIPVFISTDQGMGKTSGLKYTAGKREWYGPTSVDITNPGGIEKFLNAVRGKVIVELSEGSTIKSKRNDDPEAIKTFITMDVDQYRKPYAKHDEAYPRHFIMASTSNIDNLFTDLTGNRRFYPVYAHEVDRSIRTEYNVQQMWAEAYVMYMAGEKEWIYPDWKPALIMQEYCLQDNARVDIIDNWLDDPRNGHTQIGSRINKFEIFNDLFHYGEHTIPSKEHETAWLDWTKGTKGWKKIENPYKFNGRSVRGYIRVKKPGEASNLAEACIDAVEKMSEEEKQAIIKDAYERAEMIPYEKLVEFNNGGPKKDENDYDTWCEGHGIKDMLQIVPIVGASMNQVARWVAEGFILLDEDLGEYVNMIPR